MEPLIPEWYEPPLQTANELNHAAGPFKTGIPVVDKTLERARGAVTQAAGFVRQTGPSRY